MKLIHCISKILPLCIIALLFCGFIFVLSLTACENKKTTEAEHIVNEWIGKTIQFFDIEAKYASSKDSLKYISAFDTADTKGYKILFYVDSTGCTSCKLRLYVWKAYIKELGSNVDFLFYFQPKNEKQLLSFLKNEQFNYPVYIDNKNELGWCHVFIDITIGNLNASSIFQFCFIIPAHNAGVRGVKVLSGFLLSVV